jgi:surfeit locus 1 family protein
MKAAASTPPAARNSLTSSPDHGPAADRGEPRPLSRLILLGLLLVTGLVLLSGLGVWQIHRRAWKLDLIARVDRRVHAPPVAVPGPAQWPAITAARDEYRRVAVTGRFLNDRETLVRAVTQLGGGFWVITPLRATAGFTVLVNRGFVPPERSDPATRPAGQTGGPVTVTGLLRLTEPRGAFLHRNLPGQNRWYSRDVAAIAAARHLADVAPYFIDADASPNPGGFPVGGLTVISFPNNHLQYALTWFTLALMLVGAMVYVARDEWRLRRGG